MSCMFVANFEAIGHVTSVLEHENLGHVTSVLEHENRRASLT